MRAISMLTMQHREVESLFDEFESASQDSEKQAVFNEIADQLAAHATIEERHFYPAVKMKDTQGQLTEAVREHFEMKRLIAELLELDASDEGFDDKVAALKEAVEHHVEEEEGELFPKVRQLMTRDELEMIGVEMEDTLAALMAEGEPRANVPAEIEQPAQI